MKRRPRRASTSTFKREVRIFLSVCSSVNTPRSLACAILAKNGEWSQYLALGPCDPERETFADDYLVSEMMRKNPRLPTGINTEQVAKKKFLEAEAACAATNARFREWYEGRVPLSSDVNTVIERARHIIAAVLGPLTRKKLTYCSSQFRFGPGATSAVTGADVLLSKKLTCSMHVTPSLYPYARAVLGPGSAWSGSVEDLELRPHSRVTTVPKDAKTDRCICVEPHLNIFVQLGIGALIRRQLRLSGLDLNTQSRNQQMASRAQRDRLSTIDLSSASDTIAKELVWLLLPVEWASLLDLARTEYSLLDDEMIRLEKWSSMGNGYTFELESLIFWALARASGDDHAVAYGDDIILREQCAELLIRTLDFCGFSVNTKKTFLAGRFFESCGSDWWNGQNIRPFYIRGDAAHVDAHFLRITNAISRYASLRGCAPFYKDGRFLPAWIRSHACLSSLAKTTCLADGYGDDGLVVDHDEALPSYDKRTSMWRARVLKARPVKSKRSSRIGCYLAALAWGTPSETSRSKEYVRGSIRYAEKTATQLLPEWRNLGPWA